VGECSAIPISCDSAGALSIIHNPVLEDMRKHIDVILHHVCERQDTGYVGFSWVSSSENVADIFTKVLPRPVFEKHRANLRLSISDQ
jgi:hypothetical protein